MDVLNEIDNIDNGIGTPILNLSIFLLIAWLFIASILIKGIHSSGKASYFLALFPYLVIAILLVRALTLEGAWNGIIYFIKPDWNQIFKPSVSYLMKKSIYIFILFIIVNLILGLVCCSHSMFFFPSRWIRKFDNVFIFQQIWT